jgi:hypothetical protein
MAAYRVLDRHSVGRRAELPGTAEGRHVSPRPRRRRRCADAPSVSPGVVLRPRALALPTRRRPKADALGPTGTSEGCTKISGRASPQSADDRTSDGPDSRTFDTRQHGPSDRGEADDLDPRNALISDLDLPRGREPNRIYATQTPADTGNEAKSDSVVQPLYKSADSSLAAVQHPSASGPAKTTLQ